MPEIQKIEPGGTSPVATPRMEPSSRPRATYRRSFFPTPLISNDVVSIRFFLRGYSLSIFILFQISMHSLLRLPTPDLD